MDHQSNTVKGVLAERIFQILESVQDEEFGDQYSEDIADGVLDELGLSDIADVDHNSVTIEAEID